MSKMYLLIKDSVPDNLVPLICAHASLAAWLKYESTNSVRDWVNNSFRKVVCRVSEDEFNRAALFNGSHVTTASELENKQVCCVLVPMVEEYPPEVKKYELWKPTK